MKYILFSSCVVLVGCADSRTFDSRQQIINQLREENISLRQRLEHLMVNPQVRYVPSPFEREPCPICPPNEDWLKWDEVKRAAEKACKQPKHKVGSVKLHGQEYEITK